MPFDDMADATTSKHCVGARRDLNFISNEVRFFLTTNFLLVVNAV
jgi:hypothetical protein